MSTVSEIIEAVKKLPELNESEFLERLAEVDFHDAWDHQIEADLGEEQADTFRRDLDLRDDFVLANPPSATPTGSAKASVSSVGSNVIT